MVPRTRAPDARGSMEEDRVVSNAETFETFATHYGNVMQKHKKKIKNHVISNPPRRSLRLLEKMLKEQQNTVNSGKKKIRRSYSAVSENDPEALIPVMSLSVLRTKRNYELMSGGDYTPAPIKCRRSATVSFIRDNFGFDRNDVVPVDKCSVIKCVPDTCVEERPEVKSIIQIKQDFLKNLVKKQMPTENTSRPSSVVAEQTCEGRQVSTESPNQSDYANQKNERREQVPTESPSEINFCPYPDASEKSESYEDEPPPTETPSEVITALCSDLTALSCNEYYQYLQERQLTTESHQAIRIYPRSDELRQRDEESFQCLQVNQDPIEGQDVVETGQSGEGNNESYYDIQEIQVPNANSTEIRTSLRFDDAEQGGSERSQYLQVVDDYGKEDDRGSGNKRCEDRRSSDGQSDDGRSEDERSDDKSSNDEQFEERSSEVRSPDNRQSFERRSEDRTLGDRQLNDRRSKDTNCDDRQSGDEQLDDGTSEARSAGNRHSAERRSENSCFGDSQFVDRRSGDRCAGDRQSNDRRSKDTSFGDKQSLDRKTEDRSLGDRQLNDRSSEDRSPDYRQSDDQQFGDRTPEGRRFDSSQSDDERFEDESLGDNQSVDRESGGRCLGDLQSDDKRCGNRSLGDRQSDDRRSEDGWFDDIQTADKRSEARNLGGRQSIDRRSENRSPDYRQSDDEQFGDRTPEGRSFDRRQSDDKRSEDRSLALNDRRSEDRNSNDNEDYDDGTSEDRNSNARQADDEESDDERFKDEDGHPNDRRSEDKRSNDRISIASYHEDNGMATTDYPDVIQNVDAQEVPVCFEANADDTNQDVIYSYSRAEVNSSVSRQDNNFNAIHEAADQDNNCSCDTIDTTLSCEDQHYVTMKEGSVLCEDEESVMSESISYAAVEEVENVVSHPDHDFILNSHLSNESQQHNNNSCISPDVPAEETECDHDFEPVQIRIEEISNDGSAPMVIESDSDVEEVYENDVNQGYAYYPPFQTFSVGDDNHPPGMQANGLDQQFKQHHADIPAMPEPAAPTMENPEYSSMHGPEQMFHGVYVMPPVYNCWLDVNLQPLSQVENNFIRQGAFAIKYGGNTAILTGLLHFNSEYESYLFESHFMQQPPNPLFQNGPQPNPPQQFPCDRSQGTRPQSESNLEARSQITMPQSESNLEARSETEDEESSQQSQEEDSFTEILNRNQTHPMPIEQTEQRSFRYDDKDVIEVMEIESSDDEDNDQALVVTSSSHISQSHPEPSEQDIFRRVQPLIKRMRQKFGKYAFSKKLKGYLNRNHFQRMRFGDTVNLAKPRKRIKFRKRRQFNDSMDDTKRIRLRNDLMKSVWLKKNDDRQLELCYRRFIYEVHFRNNCQIAYVVHDAVDFLCPNCCFLRGYVRYMLGLTRIQRDLKITEMKSSDG